MAGLLPHLGKACRDARIDAHVHQIDIASRAGVSDATVSRFERGLFWPHRTDRLVAAYAAEVGVRAIELWARALASWGVERGE